MNDDAITTSSYFRHIEGESCPCCVHAMKRYNGLIMGPFLLSWAVSVDVLVKRKDEFFVLYSKFNNGKQILIYKTYDKLKIN